MHSFDAKGEYVVFYDAFGFSSLHIPSAKLKTDKEISGNWFTANGGTALTHNQRANARVGRVLPALGTRKPLRVSASRDPLRKDRGSWISWPPLRPSLDNWALPSMRSSFVNIPWLRRCIARSPLWSIGRW